MWFPLTGFLLTGIGAAAIVSVLAPSHWYSPSFWARFAWIQFLNLIFWTYVAAYLGTLSIGSPSRNRLRAGLPSLGIVVFGYCATSLVLVCVDSQTPSGFFSRLHISMQIGLAVLATLLFMGIYLASSHGDKDENDPDR